MQLSDDELVQVSVLAEKQVILEERIEKGEALLKQLTAELNQIRDKDLPAAMQEIGVSSITLTNGKKIEIKTEVYASIPKDGEHAGKALPWLRDHNFGGLIKNVISTEFGKGEDDKAIQAATVLAEAGFTPTQKETVHPQTLKAFLKEQLAAGAEIPLELFGAFVVDRAKVK